MGTPSPAADTAHRSHLRSLAHHWPIALGLALAALMLADADRDQVAVVTQLAAVCYLAAAALNRPWVGWAAIGGCGLLVLACELLGPPPWVGFGVAGLALVVIGVLGRASRPALTAQTAALLGYGGITVLALYLAPRLGLVLAALTLIAHGVWDVVHYRRNQVVPRSLSEFCMFLDVPLGVGVLILAATG